MPEPTSGWTARTRSAPAICHSRRSAPRTATAGCCRNSPHACRDADRGLLTRQRRLPTLRHHGRILLSNKKVGDRMTVEATGTAYRTCPLCEAACGLTLTTRDGRIV